MAEGIRLAFPPSVYRKVRDRGLRMFSAFASETSRPKARHRQLAQMECLVQATGWGGVKLVSVAVALADATVRDASGIGKRRSCEQQDPER